MTKSKKIFMGAAVVFLMLLGYASFDIGKRTTFPHRKNKVTPERETQEKDSIESDPSLLMEKK